MAPVSEIVPAASGFPARSVAAVETVHLSAVFPCDVCVPEVGVPRVTTTVAPLITIVEPVKLIEALTYFLPVLKVPRAVCTVLAEFHTVTTSGFPFVKRTVTGVDAPVQPVRIDAGLIASEKT